MIRTSTSIDSTWTWRNFRVIDKKCLSTWVSDFRRSEKRSEKWHNVVNGKLFRLLSCLNIFIFFFSKIVVLFWLDNNNNGHDVSDVGEPVMVIRTLGHCRNMKREKPIDSGYRELMLRVAAFRYLILVLMDGNESNDFLSLGWLTVVAASNIVVSSLGLNDDF